MSTIPWNRTYPLRRAPPCLIHHIPFLTFVYTNEADEIVLLVLMEYGLLIGLACSVYILNSGVRTTYPVDGQIFTFGEFLY